MELKEFAEEVLRGVEEKAGGKLKMRLVPREKNNSVTLTGITAFRPEGSNGAFTVSDKNMEVWRKDEKALYQTAVSNMRLDGKPVFEDMEKIIRSIMPEEIPDFAVGIPKFRFYVLTNPKKVFGAVELLDGSTLKEIGDELGG